jgi:hypothetical protein
MGEPSRRAIALATIMIITAVATAGCSSGGDRAPSAHRASGTSTPESTAGTGSSGTGSAGTDTSPGALRSAVLTTAELPVGGWTEKPDTSSDGDDGGSTSSDAQGPGACAADFSQQVPKDLEDADNESSQWSREQTSSFLREGVAVDPGAKDHVQAIADAVRGCPTAGSTYTIDGQQQLIATTLLDLGSWGDATACVRFEVSASDSVAGKSCLVADDGFLILVTTGSAYSFQLAEDDEVRKIVDAAVTKAEQHLH